MNTKPARSELLTAREAAERLRVGRAWVYRHAASGDLPSLRLGDDDHAPLRISSADLVDYLERARTEER